MELDQNTVVHPPNKGFERKIELSTIPVLYNHLQFIDFNEKGEAILGCSSVSDTLWEGILFHFNNEEDIQQMRSDRYYIGSTVSDGKFLTDNRFVVAEDTGILNILSIPEDGAQIDYVNYYRDIDRILRLDVWKIDSRILTCAGNSISIWEANADWRKPVREFRNYHTGLVNDVATLKTHPNIFASASTDRKCCLWDDRNPIPASILYVNEFCSLTSVVCNQKNTNYIVVGTEGGDVYLLDKREPKEFISVANCNCYIHRLALDDQTNKLAVCGDLNKVFVFKCEDEILDSAYCNDKHCDFVRGLAWYKESLYTCGFDKQVIKHLF